VIKSALRVLAVAVLAVTTIGAQEAARFPQVSVTAGRSTVVSTTFDITRIAITNPAVADAVVVQPREILVDGKSPGTISLMVWGAGERVQYDVVVEQPISSLEQQLHQLFPGEEVVVTMNADGIVLSGRASSTQTMLRIGEVVRAAQPKANVINMLQVPGGTDAQQVMLQVRIAEVNRRAVTELGTSFFTGPTGVGDWIGRGTTGQFPSVNFSELTRTEVNGVRTVTGQMEFNDFLNSFLFNTNWNAGALIRALKQTGHFQSLAEPNLIAYNNREASFLAGGEFPVPIVSSIGQVSIQFKEFGVRLNFTPTIAGDLIRLKVRPEVSELDFNNGITLEGFRIPALTTRRAETEVELRDGQSFAIAGLIDNTAQIDTAAIPLLSQVPIIGHLFKSKADRKERSELLVLITPRLVRALNPDEVPPLPTLPGRFLPPGDDLGGRLDGGSGTVDGPPADNRDRR
jgi:pilus assembly protein CpaC